MLSRAASDPYAAATFLYQTQWQAASPAEAAMHESPTARSLWMHSEKPRHAWTIKGTSGIRAASQARSVSRLVPNSTSAAAVAAVAELLRALQQRQIQDIAPELLDVSTVAAVPATYAPVAHGYARRTAAAQAGAALGGAVRTAVLEDDRVHVLVQDVARECSHVWETLGLEMCSAAAGRAGAIVLAKVSPRTQLLSRLLPHQPKARASLQSLH